MTTDDLTDLTLDELAELAYDGDEAAAREIERRMGGPGQGADDDEPCDWRADRAADAWERGRDRVAERAR